MRILFTSRDPGSALQYNAVANYLNESKNAITAFISEKNISNLFTAKFNKSLIISDETNNIPESLSKFIFEFNPEFVFLGLSLHKESIDYLICELCIKNKIICGSIQDYHGWMGAFDISVKPNYFFVLDEYAKDLTIESGIIKKENIFISGSPKHFEYFDKINDWIKKSDAFPTIDRKFIFFSQPINMPGIKYNLEYLCGIINEIDSSATLYIKPHPLELDLKYYGELSNNYNVDIWKMVDLLPEVALLHFENIFNCFSTIAYDCFFLYSKVINSKKNTLHNLFLGKAIQKSMDDYNFDIALMPQYDFGKNYFTETDLKNQIEVIINTSKNTNMNLDYYDINKYSNSENPSERIYNTLFNN